MDWNAWIPVAMVLAGTLAAWVKNRSQDAHIEKLERKIAVLQERVDECEKDRRRLELLVKRGYDFPP